MSVAQALEILPQQLMFGLTLGSIYALLALGYTMVYGILNIMVLRPEGIVGNARRRRELRPEREMVGIRDPDPLDDVDLRLVP